MGSAHNDNDGDGVRILEARFHHRGRRDEFVVVGRIFCRNPWVVLEVATNFEEHVPESCSADSIVSNLTCLAFMSHPRSFDALWTIVNRHWSFVVAEDETGSRGALN